LCTHLVGIRARVGVRGRLSLRVRSRLRARVRLAQVVHAPVLIARAVGAGAFPRVQRRRHGVRVALEQVDLSAAWEVASLVVASWLVSSARKLKRRLTG